MLNENEKQNFITIQLTYDCLPTLAKQISLQYDQNGTWLTANKSDNYLMQNCGNGTYIAWFSTSSQDANSILVQATDENGIVVQASTISQPNS
jgi:hypothetical protein